MAFQISEERRRQDFQYIECADPKFRKALKRLASSFDDQNSPLKIVREYFLNNEKLNEELRNMMSKREIFLAKVSSELTM